MADPGWSGVIGRQTATTVTMPSGMLMMKISR